MKSLILCALLCGAWHRTAHAQSKTQQVGGFTVVYDNLIIRPDGVRLEGGPGRPARLESPQINFSAPAVAFDFKDKQVTQVRAINGVNFKLDLAGADPIQIESKSQTATFDAVPVNGRRTLRLTGAVDGFYAIKGARNTLSGERATITFGEGSARDILVQVAGGTGRVQLQLASALFGSTAALGDVTLSAADAEIDEKNGTATFKGDASIVSIGKTSANPQNFKVEAPAFVANFAAENGRQVLRNIQTQGRASIVIDAPDATQNQPTHFEVMADNASVDPKTQNLLLNGNVSGFYTSPGENGGAPLRYDFSDVDKATARFVPESEKTADMPAGLNFKAEARPNESALLELPNFDLGLK